MQIQKKQRNKISSNAKMTNKNGIVIITIIISATTVAFSILLLLLLLPSPALSLVVADWVVDQMVQRVCRNVLRNKLPVPRNCSCHGRYSIITGVNVFVDCATELLCIDPPKNRLCGYPRLRTRIYTRNQMSQTSLNFNLTEILGFKTIIPIPLYVYLNHTVPISIFQQPLNIASCSLYFGRGKCQSCTICNNGMGITFNCSNIVLVRMKNVIVHLPEITKCIELLGPNPCTSTNRTGLFYSDKDPPEVKVSCPKNRRNNNKYRLLTAEPHASKQNQSIEDMGLPTTQLLSSSYDSNDHQYYFYYPNRYIDYDDNFNYSHYQNDIAYYYHYDDKDHVPYHYDDPYQYIEQHYDYFDANYQNYTSTLQWYHIERNFRQIFDE